MFDGDELEQIREDRDEWEPSSDGDSSRAVSKRRFAGSLSASVVILALLISMVVSMNMAVATSVGQVGGFQADFPELQGETLNIYPAIGESSACLKNTQGQYGRATNNSQVGLPLLKADIRQANITKLPVNLTKDIRLPDMIPQIDVVRINLTQFGDLKNNKVLIGNASLHLTKLKADRIVLSGGATIQENYSDGRNFPHPIMGPDGKYKDRGFDYGEFSITGTQATMVNGTARAHFLGFQRLTMPNMTLNVELNPPQNSWFNKTNSTCGQGLWTGTP